MTLTNEAPRGGLPRYVTTRADRHGSGVRPGDNPLLVTYYAGAGAKITSVTLDGVRHSVTTQPEGNTVAATSAIELPVRRSRKRVVSIREPATARAVQLLRQPGVRAASVQVFDCR